MRRLSPLPPAFRRYEQIGGVLDFAVFEECEGTEDAILAATVAALGGDAAADAGKLRTLGGRQINEAVFFGDWYDMERRALLWGGTLRAADGTRFTRPSLIELEGVRIASGAAEIPACGAGGQFAYAFANPPYSLRAPPAEVAALFDAICAFVIPPALPHDVLDWSSERLVEVSEVFAAGMEWWGVFLFSIHVPALRRLTIIVGSSTD
jgi:hypothetical protein